MRRFFNVLQIASCKSNPFKSVLADLTPTNVTEQKTNAAEYGSDTDIGGFRLDARKLAIVFANGQQVMLTAREYELLNPPFREEKPPVVRPGHEMIVRSSVTFDPSCPCHSGGTALHKLCLQPQARYSEDIDLVQIHPGPIKPIVERLDKALAWLPGKRFVLRRFGFRMRFATNLTHIPPMAGSATPSSTS